MEMFNSIVLSVVVIYPPVSLYNVFEGFLMEPIKIVFEWG